MKQVKKFLFVGLFMVLAVSASAQLNWGVKAGFNASGLSEMDLDYKAGFQAGVMAQFNLPGGFGIESGLYYSMLGAQKDKVSANPSYLQLPVLALYRFNVGPGLSLYPSAGIYLGYGIAGDYKTDVSGKEVKFDYFNDNTEKFDMGLSIGANLQFSKFVIGLGYDYGLTEVSPIYGVNSNVKVTLGYFF